MTVPVFVDTASFPHATAYYERSRFETTATGGQETIGRVHAVELVRPRRRRGQRRRRPQATFENLLEAILDHTPEDATGTSFIQVHHGSENGIALPLVETDANPGGHGANADNLNLLSGSTSSADIASNSRIAETRIARLRELRNEIRARQFQRIMMRGCKIGLSNETLRAIKRFTGASAVEAPTVLNTYSRVSFEVNRTIQASDTARGHRDYRYDTGSGAVGFRIEISGISMAFSNARMTSLAALREWLSANFHFADSTSMGASNVPLHFQLSDRTTRDLSFPATGEYRQNLANFAGGAEPTLDLSGVPDF